MDDIRWDLVKVLIVDDDPLTLKLMEKTLKKLGCAVALGENGVDAIKLIKKYNFDICFMDIMMPRMGGIETTLIIREELKKTFPIIAFTSLAMHANKQKCLENGMNGFIQKPVNASLIKDIIEDHLF